MGRYIIDVNELYKLEVPNIYYSAISNCVNIDSIKSLPIPKEVKHKILSYLQSPEESQVEKLYSLTNKSIPSPISFRSSLDILTRLDPEQTDAVNRPIDKGPYLIRGGPGTGKTLILIERMANEDVFSDLFRDTKPTLLFLSFTKTLTEFSRVSNKFLNKDVDVSIEFNNLDRLFSQYKDKSLRIINDNDGRRQKFYFQAVEKLKNKNIFDAGLLDKFRHKTNPELVLQEFEKVITSNNIRTLDGYLQHKRTGFGNSIRKVDRKIIWNLFNEWLQIMKHNKCTRFSLIRRSVLLDIENNFVEPIKYDGVFVDEVQDLDVTSLVFLTHIVRDTKFITLAGDSSQSIYTSGTSWKSISEQYKFHKGNSIILKNSYRMTREIYDAIKPLSESNKDLSMVFSGPKPNIEYVKCVEWNKLHYKRASEIARDLINNSRINPSQIAIIVPFNKHMDIVVKEFNEVNIPCRKIKESFGKWDESDSVNIINAHSAKGLEFQFVIAINVTSGYYPPPRRLMKKTQQEIDDIYNNYKRLLYVVLSRAHHQLWVISDIYQTPFYFKQLNMDKWNQESFQ